MRYTQASLGQSTLAFGVISTRFMLIRFDSAVQRAYFEKSFAGFCFLGNYITSLIPPRS